MTTNAAISALAFNSFGDMLRYLRRRAGLQQRDLAIAVGYSESQICRLEQNHRLPDLATLAARFLPALALEEEPEMAARLLALAAEARGEQRPAPIAAPAQPTDTQPKRRDANLPAPLTTLINRTGEIAAVRASLERPNVRLLTLVGPPGIGKTRLSLQVAGELSERFADGVCFVALAPVRDPALVLPTIAHTLSVKLLGGQPILETLRAALRDRQILLVLDNVEQLLAAAPDVADLLRHAPRLKILATSRAPLRLSGEHLFVVPALELPDLRQLPDAGAIARYPAVQLFVDRVRAVQPGFELTAENAATIVEICARLDALPLAIELAAARGRLFRPRELLARLRGVAGATALEFLVDGPRDLLAHQRTLRGTIDWSYDLLDEAERRLFARLAVFVGGCTAEAAEAITFEVDPSCSYAPLPTEERRGMSSVVVVAAQQQISQRPSSPPLLPGAGAEGRVQSTALVSVINLLESLMDKSLLKHEIGADGESRFAMLETIREYARERLEASGELQAARDRHAAYYLGLAQAFGGEPSGARQERWIRRLEAEYNNLWSALEWYAAREPERALRLASSLKHFWHVRGYLAEGRRWLEQLLEDRRLHVADCRLEQRSAIARGLCVAGFLAYHQGDLAPAIELSERGLALGRALADRRIVADALYNLGGVAFLKNEYARAAALFGECIALFREQGDQAEVALVLKSLGLIAKDQGDFARATRLFEESLALRRELGDRRGVAQILFSLGVLVYWQGDYSRSFELTEQSVAIYRGLGDRMGVAYALDNLAMVALRLGEPDRAARLLEESLGIFHDLGDQVGIAMAQTDRGEVELSRAALAEACRWYLQGLSNAGKVGDKRRIAFCLEGLAAAAEPGGWERSATLYGAAEALREALGTPLPPAERAEYERRAAVARAEAPNAPAFRAAWERGRALSVEEAVEFARNN